MNEGLRSVAESSHVNQPLVAARYFPHRMDGNIVTSILSSTKPNTNLNNISISHSIPNTSYLGHRAARYAYVSPNILNYIPVWLQEAQQAPVEGTIASHNLSWCCWVCDLSFCRKLCRLTFF